MRTDTVAAPVEGPAAGDTHVDSNRRLRRILIAVMAVAALVAVVAGSFYWGTKVAPDNNAMPTVNSVDAGFARDMATHHQQAVTMAGYVRDNPSNRNVANLAYDIETSQMIQLGEMTGWLDTWGISRTSGTPMSWMPGGHHMVSAGGLMPGMATPAQMAKLQTLHGKAMDILFLQLMIRHHQGGVEMARYATQHAQEPYVRTLAGHMLAAQSTEIIEMEQLLRQLGGTPLPPPAQ
jgi:uncharacterized protein (DUF305 family)